MSKAVLSAHAASTRVLEFVPPKFELGAPEQAISYLEKKKVSDSSFRMSDVIRVQTGVNKIEASNVEEEVESKVLERLKEVQEGAYQEAHQLGMNDGRRQAFQDLSEEIKARLQGVDEMMASVANLKKELFHQNESHLVQLAFHMANMLQLRLTQQSL